MTGFWPHYYTVLLSLVPVLLNYVPSLLNLVPVLLNYGPFLDLPHASCPYALRTLNVPSFLIDQYLVENTALNPDEEPSQESAC